MVDFNSTVTRLRNFFTEQGFFEIHTQSKLSILAACEDPKTIVPFYFNCLKWPLPQTGQMWLEHELLTNNSLKGVFCLSTSYRNETNPIQGRHDLIFPMFEFESHGDMNDLRNLEKELLQYLGFNKMKHFDYEHIASKYCVQELKAEHETRLAHEYGPAVFLENFPIHTSPFWNMRLKSGKFAAKIDVLLHGMETIGSAERSCNIDEMRKTFYSISGGEYAKILFGEFGKDRVEKELEEFLSFDFFPRFGGGIGITRLIRALKLNCAV